MRKAYISKPVVNLWKHPKKSDTPLWIDRNLETQLLLGDVVNVYFEKGDFAYVEAVSQDVFCEGSWSFYKGYIEKNGLDFNEQAKQVQERPESLMVFAKKFLGSCYLWGGCSEPLVSSDVYPFRGVDCSGLVHLAYKSIGLRLPRNAHDQYLITTRVPFNKLKEGDLLFSSESGLDGRIDHVMMLAEDKTLIESVMKQGVVRQICVKEKFGKMLDPNLSTQVVENLVVYTGSVTKIPQKNLLGRLSQGSI